MKSILCSFNWIASSGSLKLLEMNTQVSLGGYIKPEYDFDFNQLALYCATQSFSEVKLHESIGSYQGTDFKGNQIPSVSPEVYAKFSGSLAAHNISSSLYIDPQSYHNDGLTEVDTTTVLDLRVASTPNSKLDYYCINKENLITYIHEIGSGSLLPETGSSQITSSNPSGIPDFVWKVPTADMGTGVYFYESSSNNTTISSSNSQQCYVEKYYVPDNDKWGYFVGDITYSVILTESGSVIPVGTDVQSNRLSFSRVSDNDYTNKDLILRHKNIYAGICGEDTEITLADGSKKTPLQIHSSSISNNVDSVKTAKIDTLNLNDFSKNTPSERQESYTSYTGNFTFTTGSNYFTFVPKYSENCVNIDGTIFDSEALIPVESASSWEIKKASDIVVGDKYLSSSMDKGTVGSVGATSNQDLVHFLITYPQGNPDMYYHRNVFCDGILTLVENKMYTVNSPAFGAATGSTSASNAEINSYVSTSIQQWELLNHNSVNGTLFNGSNYSATVARYSENILNRIVSQFSSSVWEW